MLLSNWLRPLRSRIRSRRDSRKAAYVPTAMRTHQAVEQLETRLYLSGLTSYSTASADWFGNIDASFSSASGIGGSSTSDGASNSGNVRQFLVRLTPEATAQAGSLAGVQELISDSSVELVVTDGLGLPGQVIVATTERDSVLVIQSLDANPAVAYFEEDFSVGATTRFPNENPGSAEFSRQFGLNNTGQTGGIQDADINAPEAWDITIGSVETVVSVIDSGVDFTHPDLYLNIWINQGEIPQAVRDILDDIDTDPDGAGTEFAKDGLITFRDLNTVENRARLVAGQPLVRDINGNTYIDAEDLLDDPFWADGIDTDDNGFEDDLVGWDFFENDNKPFDEHRHGTHVAGILGAVGDNANPGPDPEKDFDGGVVGVNWQTSMMPLRFLDENNSGDISDAVEAINYTTMMRNRAVDPVNVRVSNNSWGSSGSFSQTLFDAVAGNLEADILFVAAAGNGNVLGQGIDNDDLPFFPANLELANVISVAALNDRGELAAFSNFGTTTVDIAAPGVDIVSTEPGDGYISRSGTSMATPFVSGVAALVFDQFPNATAEEVRAAILSGAETIASLNDSIAGSRSLNALGALTASTFAPVPELVPVTTITADGTLNVDITVTYTDDGAVDVSSFDVRDVEVTRLGFSETLLNPVSATTTTINVDGEDRDAAVYRFTAPGGTWDATENGTWFVSLREGEILDDLGLYSAPRQLGQFTVDIEDPNVFFVNTTRDTIDADPGDGVPEDSAGRTSIRAAIMHANQAGAATTIVVPDGVYALTISGQSEDAASTGDLDLTSPEGITLIGAGALSTIIDGQQLDRVFDVTSVATATLRGLAVQNGNAEDGGGIKNAGVVTIDSSIIADNTADDIGGGIYSTGGLTISNSSVEDNQTTSRFFGVGGGGLAVVGASGSSAGQTSIQNTSIVNNTSSETGGGVVAFDAELSLTNVTVSGNTAQRGDGGGLLLRTTDASKSSLLTSVSVTQNDALSGNGGGLATDTVSPQVTLSNSIVTGNLAGVSADVEGQIISNGNNLFGQPSETNADWRRLPDDVADFDLIGTAQSPLDAGLGPLTRNSGVVQSHSPVPNGAAANSDLAGIADLALTPGLAIIYSTLELEPNNSRAEAMRLDDRGWSLDADANIANSTTIPHVTIAGTGDGTFDYFSFTVSEANATAVFEIDNGSLSAGEAFNTELYLFDSSDNLLASNDDASMDPGSSTEIDARIEHTFSTPGYYTLAVGASDSSHSGSGQLTGTAPPDDTRYVLNISLFGHAVAATNYTPTSPDTTLFAVAGTSRREEFIFSAREGSALFQPTQIFTAGELTESAVLGDMNGDGINDIVSANLSDDSVSVLRGNGDGTFQVAQNFAAGDGPHSVVLGDVNGDGFNDIVTASRRSGDSVSVLLGNGDGTFQAPQHFAAGDRPYSVVLGDVNGDGIDDIVTANAVSDDVSVLRGNGDGTFQAAQNFSTGYRPVSVVLGDVNGDGFDDIVTANSFINDVNVLRSNGDGTFQAAQNFSTGNSPNSVVLGDVNGDGIDDIVTANVASNDVSVLRGNGDGTFQSPQDFSAGNGPFSVALGDVNGDGIDDIVTANGTSHDVSVLRSNGDGTFQAPQNFQDGTLPRSVALGDVNGDGIDDIVTGHRFSVRVLQSRSPVVVSRSTGAEAMERFPAVGFPFLWTEASGIVYWLADGPERQQYALWSLSQDNGIQRRAVFASSSRPVGLEPTSSQLTVTANGIVFLFDPASESLEAIGTPDGTFQSAQNFAADSDGRDPESVALGDLNGDGFDDIVTANGLSGVVNVLRSNGDGTFQASQEFSTGSLPVFVVLGDVNGDGIDDIVTSNDFSDNVSVLRGNGDGTFQPAQNFAAGTDRLGSDSFALGDVNGDGIDDIVTSNEFSDDLNVLRGNGDGTFQAPQNFDAGFVPSSVVLGDVNGDGFNDLVTSSTSLGDVRVLRGNGDGTFEPAQKFAVGLITSSVVLGDVNGDEFVDIVTAGFTRGVVSGDIGVLRGNGDGTFQAAQKFAVGNNPTSVVLSDVNGDGFDDIVTANFSSNNVSVLRGNGDGTFREAQNFTAGQSTVSVAVGDVNGDGIGDIVTANRSSDDVSVLRGNGRLERDLVQVGETTVAGTLSVRPAGTSEFQALSLNDVTSDTGLLRRRGDYEPIRISTFENQLLALVRLTAATSRPDELQLLLIEAPEFDPGTGRSLPSDVENLTLNSSLRLTVGEDTQLFVTGDRIYLTAEIIGSGFGEELLTFDRTSGLSLVGDLLPGSESSQARDFAAAGDEVYFTALTSRVDNNTQQTVQRRELFVLDVDGNVEIVRSGQVNSFGPSVIGDSLFFASEVNAGEPAQLFRFDTTQQAVSAAGAMGASVGAVTGTVFLDRNSDGRRNADEPGRPGVTLFVDINNNGRREASEPSAVTRLDDPATSEDESGQYEFTGLAASDIRIREVPQAGFNQTSPLQVLETAPQLTLIDSATPDPESPGLGLPSVIGGNVVFVDQTSTPASQLVVNGDAVDLTIPDEAVAVQSLGTVHAQDGSSIVFTARLVDGRELVLEQNSRGAIRVVVDTGQAITSQPPGGVPSSTTLTDIQNGLNGSFDTLSISGGSAGFLAQSDDGNTRYYLGGISDGRFAGVTSGQATLEGDNEVFVDRVVEETGAVVSGSDLFLDKATLDVQVGGNTGWRITTRTGEEILPLTFFDRIFDVSVSGLSAVFRAIDIGGNESVFVSSVNGGLVRIADHQTTIPDGTGSFTIFGSNTDNTDSPSVALDGDNVLFIGRGIGGQIGLYAQIDGQLRTIVDAVANWGGKTLSDISIGHQALSGNRIVFRASFTDGTEGIYLAELPAEPVATVTVTAGETTSGVQFGASARPGTIRGTSFTDTNVDGVFDPGEERNAGRTVFLDANLNGQLDDSEISTATDASGEFVFLDLPAETTYVVREVLPEGLAVTVPQTLADATVRLGAAGTVEVVLGSVDSGALGNSADGVVTGVVFNDLNGDGRQNINEPGITDEPGIEGITVFIDEDGEGELNGGERSTRTLADGSYTLNQLLGNSQEVRVVLPDNSTDQTNALENSFQTQKVQTNERPAESAIVYINDDEFPDLVLSVLNVGELRTALNDGNGNFINSEGDIARPGTLKIGGSADVIVPLRLKGEANPSAVVVAHPNLQRVHVVTPDPLAPLGFSSIELVNPADSSENAVLSAFADTLFVPRGIVTGDFNDDTFDDIAIAAERGPTGKGGAVVIFTGNAQGTFSHEQTLFIDKDDADAVLGVAAGRFTDNGAVDLVVTGFNSHTAVVLRNSGTAGVDANRFTIERTLVTINQRGTSSVQIADLDGNGQGDIVVANSLSGSVSLFEGNADGSFKNERQFPAGKSPTSLKLLDLDNDGKDDIIFTVVAGSDRIGILRNLGKIGPEGRVEFQALETSGVAQLPDGTTAFSLTIGQLDSNETPDVVVTLRRDPGVINSGNAAAGVNTVNVSLNSVVPGGRNVDLPTDTRQVAGQNFGLLAITSGITVSKSSVSVSESGTTDTFTVQLDTQPTSDVVLSVVSDDTGEATVDKATLTFTSSNWDQPQIVTVRGVDDLLVDGDVQSAITISVVDGSSDDTYDAVANRAVNVTTTDNGDAAAPTQIVSAERSELFGLPGGTVSFDLKYDTSDTDSTLSGLSFRLHFDSTRLSWVAATNLLDNGFDIAFAGSPQADSTDLDGNAATDSFVLFNFLDNALQFPSESLPATLATVTFNVSESLESATPVTFTESETAATDDQQGFYRFNSVTATVSPAVVNLDVDDDGRVRANTDGLTILRYLLGQRGADLARTVFLGGNRTDPAEIAAFLDAGLGTMLDVDDDGRARANTDGLTTLRYMLGQDNTDLVRTIFLGGQRTDAADVRSHLESFDPTVTAVSSATTAARPAPVGIDAEPAESERPQNTLQFRSPFSQTETRSEPEATEFPEGDSANTPASTEVETSRKATVPSDEGMAFSATVDAVLTANEWLNLI